MLGIVIPQVEIYGKYEKFMENLWGLVKCGMMSTIWLIIDHFPFPIVLLFVKQLKQIEHRSNCNEFVAVK